MGGDGDIKRKRERGRRRGWSMSAASPQAGSYGEAR